MQWVLDGIVPCLETNWDATPTSNEAKTGEWSLVMMSVVHPASRNVWASGLSNRESTFNVKTSTNIFWGKFLSSTLTFWDNLHVLKVKPDWIPECTRDEIFEYTICVIASGKIFILFLLRDPCWAKFGSEWDDFQIAKLSLQHILGSKLSTYRQINMPAGALGIARSTFATSRQYRVRFGVQTQQFPFHSINVKLRRGNASPFGITHRTLGQQHEPEGTTCAGCDHTRRADCTLSAESESSQMCYCCIKTVVSSRNSWQARNWKRG